MPPEVAQAVIDRAQGRCEVMNFPYCSGAPGPLHHRKISGREHSVVNLLHICDSCHRWIHANPEVSYERGWLVKMSHDPAETPVFYQWRFVRLADDGTIREEDDEP